MDQLYDTDGADLSACSPVTRREMALMNRYGAFERLLLRAAQLGMIGAFYAVRHRTSHMEEGRSVKEEVPGYTPFVNIVAEINKIFDAPDAGFDSAFDARQETAVTAQRLDRQRVLALRLSLREAQARTDALIAQLFEQLEAHMALTRDFTAGLPPAP